MLLSRELIEYDDFVSHTAYLPGTDPERASLLINVDFSRRMTPEIIVSEPTKDVPK